MDPEGTKQEDGAWQADHVRVTAFAEPFEVDLVDKWWDAALGQEPTRSVSERRRFRRELRGVLGQSFFTLKVEGTRIDWVLGPDPEAVREEVAIPSVGLPVDAFGEMSSTMSRWLTLTLPPIKRLAVGTAVVRPVSDRASGYRVLQPLLKTLVIDPEHSRDLSYQINRPRPSSSVSGLEINRLGRWSVAAVTWHTFGPDGLPVSPASHSLACRVEADVNTDASRSEPLPPPKLLGLYEELCGLAQELTTEGDRA